VTFTTICSTPSTPRKGVVYHVQQEIRQRFLTELEAAAGSSRPHVVVSHSMGTVIAYDCLKRVEDCPPVDGLLTIGSPLGFDEIIDRLRPEWTSAGGYPSERLGGGWTNLYDPFDIVAAFHPRLAGTYRREGKKVLRDVMVWNRGTWRHGISNYFARPKLRDALAELLWPGRGGSGR
jgi:pimeloyl-ACP methyl ester carboxylesterase